MRALFQSLIARTPSGRTEFFEPDEFPWIADVEARADEIREELDGLLARVDQLPNYQDIQEEQRKLTQDDRWKIFGFYAYGTRDDGNCQRCPRTAEIVESIPGMTTAFFSVLLPHKHIPPHTGIWKGVLRYHLALRTPADETAARIRVGSRIEHWRDGRSLIFDDTFEHEVWNDSDEIRVVLFVDVIRPLLDGQAVDVDGAHYCVRAAAGELVAAPGVPVPLLIGGNGTRVLQLAGRAADIAGLAGFTHNRDATKVSLTHFDAGGLLDRIAVVREAAGDRFDAVELNVLIQFVVHTDDRDASAAELAAVFGGISPEFVLDSPFVLLGTHEQMAEALVERQQRFGVSYWTVFDEWIGRESAMPDIAKVIALLR